MESYRTIAEAYHRALEFGLADGAEVDAWVESVIAAEPRPAFAFIEASSAGGEPGALLAALRDVPGVADASTRRRVIFGIMSRALDRDPVAIKKIVRALYSMALDGDVPDADGEHWMWSFDDALDLADQGIYGHKDDVRRDLVQFLRRYGEAI